MTQLDLLNWTPTAPARQTTDVAGWYLVDVMTAETVAGPYANPDEAMVRIDDLDPESNRFRLACRIAEEPEA